jgi:cell division protein FtsB
MFVPVIAGSGGEGTVCAPPLKARVRACIDIAMQNRAALTGYLRRAIMPVICLLLIAYFVSHAISGPTGVIAWKGYKSERAQLEKQVAASGEAKAALDRQVQLLDPRKVDPDLADELVRKNLNVVKPDEVIVTLDPEPTETAK